MKKVKNILFIVVMLLLVFVKVDAADYGSTPVLGETKYKKVWEKTRTTEFDESYQDVIIVLDGTVVVGADCKTASAADCSALIEKYNNDGEVVWSTEYPSAKTEFFSVVETEDGYVALLEDYSVSGFRNFSLVKYSFSGEKIWETTLITGFNSGYIGYCVLSYHNNLISAVFGDASVYLVNNSGELVKELEMSTNSYPLVQMDEKGIYVVRNVVDEETLSADLVLEVYGYDYNLVKSVVLHGSKFDEELADFVEVAIADAFDIIDGKFVIVKYDLVEDFNSTLILNDKYETVKEIKYTSDYRVYENVATKNGFLSLVSYFHNDGTCPKGARGVQTNDILNIHDARGEEVGEEEYMIVYKYSLSGEEVWKLDLDIKTDNAHIAGNDRLMMLVANFGEDDYDAHIYKYVGDYNVTTKTDGNGNNELRNISEEFENIIKEMDSELTKYSQRRNYEKKLSNLKENYENEADIINELTYEIDSLNFSIQNRTGTYLPLP